MLKKNSASHITGLVFSQSPDGFKMLERAVGEYQTQQKQPTAL